METTGEYLRRVYRNTQCSKKCEKLIKEWIKIYGKSFVKRELNLYRL